MLLLSAVFLLSLSSLTFEILLTRFFSISQWNHLSFMAISIALFGFASAGTFLNIIASVKKYWETHLRLNIWINGCLILYAGSAVGSFLALNQIPLDFFRLPLEYLQVLYLFIIYLLLILPFFFTGLLVSLSYALLPQKSGFIYFAGMAGSACGAVIPAILISRFSEGQIIILTSVFPLVLVFWGRFFIDNYHRPTNLNALFRPATHVLISLAIMGIAAILLIPGNKSLISASPSPYKSLSQTLLYPDTLITQTSTDLRGRVDTVKSPYIRFAPGLSIKYEGDLPNQWATFRDGDNQFVLYNLPSDRNSYFVRSSLTYAGYLLRPFPEHVLIIQTNGGVAIPCAISSNASKITIVEQNPHIARIVRDHYALPVVNQNPRTFLSVSHQRFDIIHIDNWGYSLPGSAALNQEHLFTTDAFQSYLNHLTPHGLLVISRKLLLPPTDTIRLWATAFESLSAIGNKNPENHIAMLRNWDSFTLLVSPTPLQDAETIISFAQDFNFDIVYQKNISFKKANQYNLFDQPYHYNEIKRLASAYKSGQEKKYFNDYPFDVSPQSDHRPFPNRYLKWSRLKQIYQSMGSRFYTLFLSGEITVMVVFFEAFILSIMLLLVPVIFISKKREKGFLRILVYFLSAGAGFIFVELFFIKQYTLLFGDPVISFTLALTGILIFTGLGGFCSQWLTLKSLKYTLISLIVLQLLIFFGFNIWLTRLMEIPTIFQYVFAFIILLPIGVLMGMPFPLGMMYILKNPVQRAYAWTANGCASVLSSIISAQIAVSLGIPVIMLCAIFAYILALFTFSTRLR